MAANVSRSDRNRIGSILAKSLIVAKLIPMSVYPAEIASLLGSVRCSRSVPANTAGTDARLDCGCFIRIEMFISDDGQIEDVGFRSNGCGYMVAVAEWLARRVNGQPLTGLSGLPDVPLQLPDDRQGCADAVATAVRNAFGSFRLKRLEEFRGETALICTCFGVTEEAVESFIGANRPESVDEVSNTLRAGSGCGSCRMLIQEIIDANG